MAFRFNFNSILDYEYSKIYLNKMAKKGLKLKTLSTYAYSFQNSDDLEEKYSLQFIKITAGENSERSDQFISEYEKKGWEYVDQCDQSLMRCFVFKSQTNLGLNSVIPNDVRYEILKLLKKRMTNPFFVLFFIFMFMVLIFNLVIITKVKLDGGYFVNLLITMAFTWNGINRIRLYYKYKNNMNSKYRPSVKK